MVRMVEHLLIGRFGRRFGFADPDVVTLDPATGTATFPPRHPRCRGLHGPGQARGRRSLPGRRGPRAKPPRLRDPSWALRRGLAPLVPAAARDGAREKMVPRVYLANTLDSPFAKQTQLPMFGAARVMAEHRDQAREVRATERVTVVIGNPPYRRADKTGSGWKGADGSWMGKPCPAGTRPGPSSMTCSRSRRARRSSATTRACTTSTSISWRWAIWKVFEAHGPGPGIVALITATSWLNGPGFVGLRELVRRVADEGWVLGLGAERRPPDTLSRVAESAPMYEPAD